MKSRKKTVITGLIIAAVAAVITFQSQRRSVDESCLAYREDMRQLATDDSGFAGVLAVPESAMSDALAARYGNLTGPQCKALLPALPADMEALTHTPWAAQMNNAAEEVRKAIQQCRDKRLAGELKTHVESVQCSNPQIVNALKAAGYPYGDLVDKFTAKRLETAQDVDKTQGDDADYQVEYATLALEIAEQERARLSQVKK